MANSEQIAAKPKAYSYLRFSTPEQARGDSSRRQLVMAQNYARTHDLELDETLTFHDVGVSAFRGQNAEAGMLAYFKEAVDSGLVPQGSILLVEQLDRISRLSPRKALRVLEDIVEAGITVVTLNDGRAYSEGSLDKDPLDLMVSILTFMRANEESATKASRLKAAWEGKREAAASVPMTGRVPAWLRLNRETKQIEVIPERADIVRRIYQEALEGKGQHLIAARLNAEGVAPWGGGAYWQRSYIAKILASSTVVGTCIPHLTEYQERKRVRRPLAPLPGYYPAVVSEKLFAEVQALQTSNSTPRGRHAAKPVLNILAGLARCHSCGRTMTRTNKGKRSAPSFVCTAAKAGAGCSYRSVRYAWVEGSILQRLPERLADLPAAEKDAELDREITGWEEWRDELRASARDLMDPKSSAPAEGRGAALAKVEAAIREAETALLGLTERRETSSGPLVGARVGVLVEVLSREAPDPAAINLAMRKVFRSVTIIPEHRMLELEYLHGGACVLGY